MRHSVEDFAGRVGELAERYLESLMEENRRLRRQVESVTQQNLELHRENAALREERAAHDGAAEGLHEERGEPAESPRGPWAASPA